MVLFGAVPAAGKTRLKASDDDARASSVREKPEGRERGESTVFF
jgi:hypothetical protein